MKENLKTQRYQNGDEIVNYHSYNDLESNFEMYGFLYNRDAVVDSRNLCPEGWQVPSDEDWKKLELFLGMSYEEVHKVEWRGLDQGFRLKDESWDGSNSSGFSALPGGSTDQSNIDIPYYGLNYYGVFWANNPGQIIYRQLNLDSLGVLRRVHPSNTAALMDYGFSVRCIEVVEGCTHPNASNYDETANVDDGSCEFETVQIGHQLWMTENLKATRYRNGDAIPNVTNNSEWIDLDSGAYSDFNNIPAYSQTYGRLYNWYTVSDERDVCPEGWHVPSDEEFKDLEVAIGMNRETADIVGWRGTNEGSKLAGTPELWIDPVLEEDEEFNITGFNAIPGSSRVVGFNPIGEYATFWSSAEYDDARAWYRCIYDNRTSLNRHHMEKSLGHSIRCLSDEIQNVTINVPGDFSAIQVAIDYAIDGDIINVSAGTYYENINFNGKNISVIGEDRETTIIDGSQYSRAIIIENNSDVSLSNLTIQNGRFDDGTPGNSSSSTGGLGGAGIFCKNSVCTFSNLIVQNNVSTYDGGGLMVHNSSASLSGLIVRNNHSIEYSSGGGLTFADSQILIDDILVENNTSTHYGGGLALNNNQLVDITNSSIGNNFAGNSGGGLYIETSEINFSNLNIINNSSGLTGGGIYLNNSTINASNLNISNNSADQEGGDTDYGQGLGGGVFASSSDLNIDNCSINSNYANQRGGGLYVVENSNLNIIDSSVSGNQAKNDVGGAIELNRSNGHVESCVVSANSASNTAGIAVISESSLNVFKTAFYDNNSYEFGRGILHIHVDSDVYAENITVSHNYSADHILSLTNDGSTLAIKNSILANNQFEDSLIGNDDEDFSSNVYYDALDVRFSNIQGGWSGAHNINKEPLFSNYENRDFTLQSSSPCVDAGDPGSPLDPDGTRADMGAYPFFHVYGCTDTQADNFDTEANTNDGSCMYRYSIPLQSGQNLVSFLELPADSSISSTLSSVSTAQSVIAEGEAANFLNGVGWVGSLTTFSKEKGYWLKVNTNDQYSVLANNPPQCNNIAYNLQAGPNLISFPCPGQYSLNEAIPEELQPFITGIVGQGQAAIGNNGQFVGSLQYLEGSKGYWFIVTQDITLNFQQ